MAAMEALAQVMPNSFTLGEALVVGQAISVAVCDVLLQTVSRRVDAAARTGAGAGAAPPTGHAYTESETVVLATKALVVAGVAVFVIGQAACLVLQSKREAVANDMEIAEVAALTASTPTKYHPYTATAAVGAVAPQPSDVQGTFFSPVLFHVGLAALLLVVVHPLLSAVIRQNFSLWLMGFMFGRVEHVVVLVYWLLAMFLALPLIRSAALSEPAEPGGPTPAGDEGFYSFEATSRRHRQLYLRKLFHLLATVMFLPVLVFEPNFLGLAFAGALAVFFVLELFRITLVPPIGPAVAGFMERFRDEKDPGPLLLTHIYLLLGCAIPVWLHQPGAPGYSTGIASLGIISIGVGDATASLVGTKQVIATRPRAACGILFLCFMYVWWGHGVTCGVSTVLISLCCLVPVSVLIWSFIRPCC